MNIVQIAVRNAKEEHQNIVRMLFKTKQVQECFNYNVLRDHEYLVPYRFKKSGKLATRLITLE